MCNFDYRDVHLRPLAEADLPTTLEWRNRERTRVWFKQSDVVTHEAHKAWFERYQNRPNEFMYIIESRTTGEKIGQVGLYAWDEEKREAELGRLMAAPSGVPTGQIAQGTIAICDWGFRHLSLKRIYCEIFSDNAASLRVARVAGLKQIGQTGKLVLYDLDPSVGLRPDSTFDTNHRPV